MKSLILMAALLATCAAGAARASECRSCDPIAEWETAWAKEFARGAKIASLSAMPPGWVGVVHTPPRRNRAQLLNIVFNPLTKGLLEAGVQYEYRDPGADNFRSYSNFPQRGVLMSPDTDKDMQLVLNGFILTFRLVDDAMIVRVEDCPTPETRSIIGYAKGGAYSP